MPGVSKEPAIDTMCEVCAKDGGTAAYARRHHVFRPQDSLLRQHRREQMPFFVLHPDSMAGGPVKWLWTNGHYDDIKSQLVPEGETDGGR